MTQSEWLETLASMDNPAMHSIGEQMVARLKSLEDQLLEHRCPVVYADNATRRLAMAESAALRMKEALEAQPCYSCGVRLDEGCECITSKHARGSSDAPSLAALNSTEGRGVTYTMDEVEKYLRLAVGDTRMTCVLANEVDRLRLVLANEVKHHLDKINRLNVIEAATKPKCDHPYHGKRLHVCGEILPSSHPAPNGKELSAEVRFALDRAWYCERKGHCNHRPEDSETYETLNAKALCILADAFRRLHKMNQESQ